MACQDNIHSQGGSPMSDDAGDGEAVTGATSVGRTLRATREKQLLTIDAIAERTRIPIRHLRAIEEGDHGSLPAIPYSAGFVKGYAQALGLDGPDYSRRFREEIGSIPRTGYQPAPYEPADPARVPSKLIALIGLIVAIVAAVAYLYVRGGPSHDAVMQAASGSDQPPAAAPLAATPVAVPAAPAVVPPLTGPVVVEAVGPVWLRIAERDGPTLFMGMMDAGKRFAVPATARDPLLKTGRPQAIKVMVGETPIPQLGATDMLLKDMSLKPEALAAYRAANPNGPPPTAPAAPPPPASALPTNDAAG
jgi:transcriptional regulator with XRE-family HTH domain